MRIAMLAALIASIPVATVWSIALGSTSIAMHDVVLAFVAFDGSRDHLVVTALRLPRAVAALLSGSALAVAGTVIQAVTKNPLAEPGLLGINAGAAFATVLSLSLLGIASSGTVIWFAFAGAAVAAIVVYALASVGRMGTMPLMLVLAGAVLTGFLTSLTSVILIFDEAALDAVRLWTAGSLSGRTMAEVAPVAPYILVGLTAAIILRRQLTTLSLGAEVARSLGQNPVAWRGVAIVIVILLAGGAVSLAGPLGFVGLVVPHIARLTIGVDDRWVIPFCALVGALLVLVADTIGRALFVGQGFPVGVTMALIGAPFFVWLARSRAADLR